MDNISQQFALSLFPGSALVWHISAVGSKKDVSRRPK